MRYFNYVTQEEEDIQTAVSFYLICTNAQTQRYSVIASPLDVLTLPSCPLTRSRDYWPISWEQIENAPQAHLFPQRHLRGEPLTLDDVQEYFKFNPQMMYPQQFGRVQLMLRVYVVGLILYQVPVVAEAPRPVERPIAAGTWIKYGSLLALAVGMISICFAFNSSYQNHRGL